MARRRPAMSGAKRTLMPQTAPDESMSGQLLSVIVNSLLFEPVIVETGLPSTAVPSLRTRKEPVLDWPMVTVPNGSGDGEVRLSALGPDETAFPFRSMRRRPPGEAVTRNKAVFMPGVSGAKVTTRSQLSLGLSGTSQLASAVTLNSATFIPSRA